MLRVCFNCYGNYTTDRVYQWDQNHILSIRGLEVTQAPAIHFCNKKSDTALVVQSKIDSDGVITVNVPNILLESPYDIIAYVHLYDSNNAKTIEVINIPLIKRVKPDDYQFEENIEIMTFERLEKDFADLEKEFNKFKNECNNTLNNIKFEYINLDGGTPSTTYEL